MVVVAAGCARPSVPRAAAAPNAVATGGKVDAEAPHPPEAAASTTATEPPAPAPPRWEVIYSRYFGPGTPGGCGQSRKCHVEAMADAASAYTWLRERGYIAGTRSPLVSPINSCLRWFGGNMPPRGTTNDEAIRDLEAWVAAGAPDK